MLASEEGGAIGAPAVMMDAIPELTKSETLEHREELEDLVNMISSSTILRYTLGSYLLKDLNKRQKTGCDLEALIAIFELRFMF